MIGGSASLLQGGSFSDGLLYGGRLGLIAGAIGGGIGASSTSMVGLGEAPGTIGGFVSKNYLTIASASLLLPITGKFEYPLLRK